MRRPVRFFGLITATLIAVAGVQSSKFPGGVFRANDGTNNIALEFDSTGVITAYVNGEGFSRGTYETRADTLTIGPVTGPEGYSCAGSGRYLWSIAENRLTMTTITDECEVRVQAFTGLAWSKG
jgi:hypothetical protein